MKKNIFNPFVRIAGLKALGLGMLLMLGGAFIAAFCNTRFDGVLDLHFQTEHNFIRPFTDQLLAWISLIIVFYSMAWISGAKPRFIDIAGTFALARMPLTVAPLVNVTGFLSGLSPKLKLLVDEQIEPSFTHMEMFSLIVLICIGLLLIVWMVVLYLNAYRTSTNLKGSRLVIGFITGLILAEILSLYLIRILFNY